MSGGAVIFCAGVVYGFFIERDAESIHLGAAGGLWALLGSLSVIARFRQWRMRKKMLTQDRQSHQSQVLNTKY
jgi:membrane associated rhomboid family serine protease